MKTPNIFRSLALAAGLTALVWGGACTKEPDIAPAARLEVSAQSVSVSKRGVDKNGNEIYIRISSNVYWTASYPEDDREWLTLSAMAGDPGTVSVMLSFKANEEVAERRTTIRIETYDGTKQDVTVIQRGTGDVIVLMNDGFAGDYNEGTPIAKYIPNLSEGVDADRINYDGTEAYISRETPSFGYEGASGGNNILLKGKDAGLIVTGIDAVRDQKFDLSFGLYAAETFTEEDFALQVSRDGEKWADVSYVISLPAESFSRAEAKGWQMAIASFKLKEPVEEFFVRLRAVADRDFRIDDIAVEEGTDAGQEIVFPGDDPDPDPDPVPGTVYLDENFDWITEDWGGSDYFNGSKPTTEKVITSLTGEQLATWTQHGFTSQGGKAYCRVGYVKIGTKTAIGDIITPKIAELTAPTDLIVTFKAVSYAASEKDNTLRVNILGAGQADVATLTIENATYPAGAQTPEQNANWKEYTVNVKGATDATQIQLQAGSAADCRFFFDDFKIVGVGEPDVPVEGLPVVWSFPATGLEDGLVDLATYSYLSDDRAARLEAVRGTIPPSAGTYKALEQVTDTKEYNNRLLMYGFALGDAWQFTVPVKHFKSGTDLRLQTDIAASAAGAKFYVLEYSVDKTQWTAVNTKTGSFGTTDGTTVPAHDITYTVMIPFVATANERCVVDETFTVVQAVEDGELYIRLRVCDALSNKLDKNIKPANGGTNRIRRMVDATGSFISEATTISLASGTPTPTPVIAISGVTGGELNFEAEDTAAKTFTVTSTVTGWTVASEIGAWADVSPASGAAGQAVTVTVTPKAANTGVAKSGKLTFSAGAATPQVVTVTQKEFIPAIDFSGLISGGLTFENGSVEAQTFNLTSNVAWSATTVADWFDFTPANGAAGAAVSVTVTPKSAYTGAGSRSGEIVFAGPGLTNTKVAVTQNAVPTVSVEGLPAAWSFPADGLTAGFVNKDERWYLADDKSARIDAVRAVNPSKVENVPMSYTINASDKQDRILMYGMFLDDYWMFTVPVKDFKANMTVNLSTIITSSGTGPKYFMLEYSLDRTQWTAVNTKTVTDGLAGSEHEIVHTVEIPGSTANVPCEVDENVTIPTAVADGNIYLRLRVCDKLSLNGTAEMKAAHNGTNRLFQNRVDVGGDVTGRLTKVTLVQNSSSSSRRR